MISWGTLFYSIGVLGPAMRQELGESELFLFGAFTAGLLLCGAIAPIVGRLVDRRGGRVVLSAGSIVGAIAMALLAAARNPAMMGAGWLLAGLAMAATLYDPAFATLSQHTGEHYRKAVGVLTLFGGFASTVFWPLSQLLMQSFGWRETLFMYAALHAFFCLPVHWLLVPPRPIVERAHATTRGTHSLADARLTWLTASLALATFVFSVLAVHVIGLLTRAGLTPQQAVLVSMLFGPMQVAGRVIEMGASRNVSAVASGFASFALLIVTLVALIAVSGMGVVAILFIAAYGVGNGVLTIARGTVPAELFGRDGLGSILGRLSRATLIARALAPASFSALVAAGLTDRGALFALILVGFAAAACYSRAVRKPA